MDTRHRRAPSHFRTPEYAASVSGERQHFAKLTNDAVRTIREMYDQGVSSSVLAERFGVSGVNILRVVKRQTWKSVDSPPMRRAPLIGGVPKLTDWDVIAIRLSATAGIHPTKLASAFMVTRGAIDLIVKGERWKHLLIDK